jgi:hypothetical protein
VTAVTPTSITITEAHYGGDKVEQRVSTAANLEEAQKQLNIYGFYRPE